MLRLQGIFCPVVTPFDHAGNLYKVKVRHNVDKWNQVKLAGYVVCGSSGEGAHLASDEKLELFGLVAEATAQDRIPIACSGAEGVRETVALTNKAAEMGYKAAMIRTPGYYKPDQELFFRAVADQCKIPVVIYNRPQSTGVDISADAVLRLSEHPNIAGIQEASADLGKLMRLLRETKKGFQVLTGSGSTLWPALDMGVAGAVVALANPAPYACITIWEAHRTREREAAHDWQTRIGHPVRLVTEKYGIPGLKFAMDLNGYYGGPCRLPLGAVTPEAKREIEEAFAGIRG